MMDLTAKDYGSARCSELVREALKFSGYKVGVDGLLVAPRKVCVLVTELAIRFAEHLDLQEKSRRVQTSSAVEILKAGLDRHRDPAGRMCGCGACRAMLGAIRALKGEEEAPVSEKVRHSSDVDCAAYLDSHGSCTVCGVSHVPGCGACGGGGFHRPGCPEVG
jgi:hypothetical protein